MARHAVSGDNGSGAIWRGVLIAEGLSDPTIVNNLPVSQAKISSEELPIDEAGTPGRWHLYWVDVDDAQIELVQEQLKAGWYARFWTGNRILVVYDDQRFEVAGDDPSTWLPAIQHGLGQGLRREWLDFPTEDP